MDMTVRRSQFAADDLWKEACKKTKKSSVPNKVKNIDRNILGDKVGRIHMTKQNLDKMGGKRVKVLRSFGKKRSLEGGDDAQSASNKRRNAEK